MLAPLAAGSAVILPVEGRFSAGTFWRDASEHGATFFTAVRFSRAQSQCSSGIASPITISLWTWLQVKAIRPRHVNLPLVDLHSKVCPQP